MTNYLLINIILLIFSVCVTLVFTFYLVNFNKNKIEVKKINWLFDILILTVLAISTIFSIIGVTSAAINKDDVSAPLALFIVGFVLTGLSTIFIVVFSQNLAVGLTKESVYFLGTKKDGSESIKYKDIIKIAQDEKSGKIYIIFKRGKRLLKSVSFLKKFANIDFFSESITGIKIEKINVNNYIKSELSKENK